MPQSNIRRIYLLVAALFVGPAHAQITWNNVYSPTPDTSAQTEAARRNMNAGFDQLRGVLKEYENTEEANWHAQKRKNTQEYLDAVYGFRTVAELRAYRDFLERKRLSFGAQIDQNVARSAFDERLSTLMQQEQWARNAR